MMMHTSKNYTGNNRFFGFCVDILERISRDVGFNYLLDLVPDRKYGVRNPDTGEWNGMVQQLVSHVCCVLITISVSVSTSQASILCIWAAIEPICFLR